MTTKWNTKAARRNAETLLAKCETTFDVAVALGNQQAEAFARKALRNAMSVLADMDDENYKYVPSSFAIATECRLQAASLIG